MSNAKKQKGGFRLPKATVIEMDALKTGLPALNIRLATEEDTPLIFSFIKGLSVYEKMADAVSGNEDILRESLFVRKGAEVIIGEYKNEPVAFALFFHNFSTFQCLPGLYLEDLFVKEEFRGLGIGTEMLACLARIALERGCGRFEWICLDWNESALKVYRKLGAIPLDGWTIQRLEGDALLELGKKVE